MDTPFSLMFRIRPVTNFTILFLKCSCIPLSLLHPPCSYLSLEPPPSHLKTIATALNWPLCLQPCSLDTHPEKESPLGFPVGYLNRRNVIQGINPVVKILHLPESILFPIFLEYLIV